MCSHTGFSRFVIASTILAMALPAAAVDTEDTHFYTGQYDLRIPTDPDASKGWMEDAVLEVPDHLIIGDLDVTVSLSHTKVFDLQLSIESPSGTTVLLNMYDPFTGYIEGQDYYETTFDDEASAPIEQGTPPFQGHFRPLAGSSLSSFDGEDACGSWAFRVYDAFYGDTGSFGSFTLAITIPEPATAIVLVLGLGLTRLAGRLRRGCGTCQSR